MIKTFCSNTHLLPPKKVNTKYLKLQKCLKTIRKQKSRKQKIVKESQRQKQGKS